jgi:hypothetical protein
MAPRSSTRKTAAASTLPSSVPANDPEVKKASLTKHFDTTFRASLAAKQRLVGTIDPDDLGAAVSDLVNEMVRF